MGTRRTAYLLIALSTSAPLMAEQRLLGVCEALNVGRNGEEISIAGEIDGHFHHGFFLSQGIGGDPCPGHRRRFFTAPSLILLAWASIPEVRLTREQEGLNRILWERLIGTSRQSPQMPRLHVKIVGVLVRKSWPLIFRRDDGSYFGTGLGMDGAFPAVLVVKSVQEEK